MSRPSRDQVYIQILNTFAQRSTCTRRQVAAVLVDNRGRILGVGYNGVPRNFTHCTDYPCPGAQDKAGDTRHCQAIHAEVNAVLNCHNANNVVTAYVSCTPCFECAKMLANLPHLRRVVVEESYADQRGLQVLQRASIKVVEINNESAKPTDIR